jgi:phosphoribosylformylglycinamidine synthase
VLYPFSEAESERPYKGIAVSCGINPNYGKVDPYRMAASSIDEALRNVVSVGGDINHTALLDNFCWGNCNRPEQLAGVVRAAEACYDMSKSFGVPFISGKDSLNNEFIDEAGRTQSIPATLLISAISIVQDVRKVVSMDVKKPDDWIYILGETGCELGGSQHYALYGHTGNSVPAVNPAKSRKLMAALNEAMKLELVRACHDCSDGGLAVTLAEMAFAGGYGMEINLSKVPMARTKNKVKDNVILFSESNSRFVVEVAPEDRVKFEKLLSGNVFRCIGSVKQGEMFIVYGRNNKIIIKDSIDNLKKSWQSTLSRL